MKIGSLRLNVDGLNTIAGFILCFCVFDIIHTYVGGLGEGLHLSWKYLLIGVPQFWVTYFALLPLAFFLAGRYRLDLRRRRSLLAHTAGALLFAYVHVLIVAGSPFVSLHPELTFVPRFFRVLRLNFAADFLTYWGILGAAYAARHHFELRQRLVTEAQLEASLVQAQLQALRAQLQPHFLFNTLQVISVLALKGDNQAVVETLGHLSNLLRVSFDLTRPQKIPLASELEFLDEYLAIQQLSVGERLRVHRDIEIDTHEALVPSTLLQPIVENAIVHGIARQQGYGTLAVSAQRLGDILRLRVSDSGPGFRQTFHREGIGLTNTRARLQRLYGSGAFAIDFADSVGGGTSVTISIPYEGIQQAQWTEEAIQA